MGHCFNCGTKLVLKLPSGDDLLRQTCLSCGYIHYEKPSVLVGVLLHHQDQVLWIKRGTEPYKNLWTFPSGFLEAGEDLQTAATRELKEETGITTTPAKMIPFGVFSILPINQIYFTFRLPCASIPEVSRTEEVSDWGWFTEDNAPWDRMAYPSYASYVRQTYHSIATESFALRIGSGDNDHHGFNFYHL